VLKLGFELCAGGETKDLHRVLSYGFVVGGEFIDFIFGIFYFFGDLVKFLL
jgi:hypothetical protein